jgi:hypothetical protein
MLGNPYYFKTYFSQEVLFVLPDNITTINKIDSFLYCDDRFNESCIVSFKNVEFCFGFDEMGSNVREGMLLSANAAQYGDGTNATKELSLQWIYKNSNGKYELINDKSGYASLEL